MIGKITQIFLSLIITLIIFLPLLALVTQAQESKIYLINLEYSNGNLNLQEIIVKSGFPPQVTERTGYTAVIESANITLYSTRFTIPNQIILEGGVTKTLEKVNFALILPFYENAKQVEILSPNGEKVLTVDVSDFSILTEQIKPVQVDYTLITIIISIIVAPLVIFVLFKFFAKRGADEF